eukprot:SAG25_NODE_1487_length_2919_cov_2.764539_3_plen_169_part_00
MMRLGSVLARLVITSNVALGREARRARNILRRVRVAGAHACDGRLGSVAKVVAVGGVTQPVGVVGEVIVVVDVGRRPPLADARGQERRHAHVCTHARGLFAQLLDLQLQGQRRAEQTQERQHEATIDDGTGRGRAGSASWRGREGGAGSGLVLPAISKWVHTYIGGGV